MSYSALIRYAVLDKPPKSIDELTNTVVSPQPSHTFEFTEEEQGKTIYFAICWQNENGECGPYSEIKSAIIP
jgi:hypothetical protein